LFLGQLLFSSARDGKFLCLTLALAMNRHKKKEGQNRSSVLGGSMSPGDLSGRDVKVPTGPWPTHSGESSKAFKAKLFLRL